MENLLQGDIRFPLNNVDAWNQAIIKIRFRWPQCGLNLENFCEISRLRGINPMICGKENSQDDNEISWRFMYVIKDLSSYTSIYSYIVELYTVYSQNWNGT